MMKRSLVLVVVSLLAMTTAPAQAEPSGAAVGFENPESMVWDAETGSWYASNFGGYGFGISDHDGNGFVAKLAPGDLTPQVWATGLDAPQGITIEGRTMYVADLDHVRTIDMDDPSQQTAITIEGASLGDLDVDPATGDVYAGELGANRIWRISGGVVEAFAEINSPDGVYLHEGGLYVATFALGGPGGIFRIDLETKEITTVSEMAGAFLDGLERDGDGWLTTDFFRGQLIRVDAAGTPEILAQLAPGAADLGFDPETRTAAVPLLFAHAAVFWTV